MRNLTRRSMVLGMFVMAVGAAAMGCGGDGSTGSGAGGSAGRGGSGTGGKGGEATSSSSSSSNSSGTAGAGGQGTGGNAQGGGGQGGGQAGAGGGNVACNPGETKTCYSGDPATSGVGTCKPGTLNCVNGQWDTTCNGEILPAAKEACDGKDEDCNGQVDDGFASVTCGQGVCQVTVSTCANGMPQTCTPGPQAAPKCDGFDEDCDGMIDEADEGCTCTDGAKQPCYSGGAGTDGIGVCKKGTQTCANGVWGACAGEVVPSMEVCDALDNDCNGQKDDGLGQTSCGTGQCAKTVNNCVNGFPQTCVPGSAMLETCNGLDDNCNGAIDDGLGTISCGVGACRVTVQACANGMAGTCTPGMPTAEICDDKDNNCNGMVDEGNPGGGGMCTTPLPGICAVGMQNCSNGTVICSITVQPQNETCNGLDDNCNGTVDDGNPGGGAACSTGLSGPCATGMSTCNNGSIACIQTVFPAAEQCDGVDNNCNGQIDENNAGGGASCTVAGKLGVCAVGAQTCTGGTLVCTQTVQPSAETCDNKDNDCNGVVDNGNPGGGMSCTAAGQNGVCAQGTTTCTGGSIACTPGTPSAETCDGTDNDCNGTVDNGNPGGGMTCTTGLPGICSAGTTACTNGMIKCNANQSPTAEVCNGLDDNCNGTADENNPGSAQPCTAAGQQGQCRNGTTTCSAGSITCVPGTAITEICDGIDNDCNGTVDNGNPGGGQFCNVVGALGECAKGTTSCTGGAITCTGPTAATEICDGKDNDCDGLIDEMNPGGGAACNTGKLGICSAGTVTCVLSALTCVQNVPPAANEVCANSLDDNCNGTVDEDVDVDGDGWGACTGDCCDSTSQCAQPELVNIGAYEILGNGINDDCDATTSDTVAPAACSTTPLQTPTTATKLVQAMDLCQFTTANPPLATKKWGVISAVLTSADGVAAAPQDVQGGVLNNYGPNVTPRKGTTMAALSSGTARDATDAGFVLPQPNGWSLGSTGNPPAAYLAAHGGVLQTKPGCANGAGANDSANLRVQIRVPTNALSFTYKFKFYSAEFPEWTCTQFNDFYIALLQTALSAQVPSPIPLDKNISFDSQNNPVSVNNGFFEVCQFNAAYPQYPCPSGTTELIGTGMGGTGADLSDGGGTNWLTTTSPIKPGETMTIEFMIWDTGDHLWDSTVLLDAFEWSPNSGAVGTTK